MDLTLVAPELRDAAKRISSTRLDKFWHRRLAQTALAFWPTARVDGVRIEVTRTSGVPLRVYHPQVRKSQGALLWIHGGGLVIGRAVQDDRLCASTALELGIVVVSVDYRLAPRHPFPAALDDCHAAWRWLRRSAEKLGVDRHKIAVGGESAGGGLAASLAQRIYDAHDGSAIGQWLFCPMLDDRTAACRELDGEGHFVFDNAQNEFAWRSYLRTGPGGPGVPPYASAARRRDLRGLPQAWIGVGDIDLLAPEDRAYAARLEAAGVAVTFLSVPGAPHGFEAWAPDSALAKGFVQDAQRWLQAIMDPPA